MFEEVLRLRHPGPSNNTPIATRQSPVSQAGSLLNVLVNTGMGLPPVVVRLLVTLALWCTGPFGARGLLYTPPAMVLAQLLVALPLVAGFTWAALRLVEPDLVLALRVDGASDSSVAYGLARATGTPLLVALAAGFGRTTSEAGASLMVGDNIVGQTRILTTAITLETGKGDFALRQPRVRAV